MCFTIEIHLSRKAIEQRFSVDTSSLYDFDFNYFYRAFTNPMIPVIDQNDPDRVMLSQWGLIPSWAGDRKSAEQIRKGTYNARSESLGVKPSFKGPLRQGRCLVIAHGFFEWQLVNGIRVPWYIRLKENTPFAFAGLCDTWEDPETGSRTHTFTIITAAANPLMEKIHNTKKRMPVILRPENEEAWVKEEMSDREALQLLLPLDDGAFHAHTVSHKISSKDADPADPRIIESFHHPVSGSLF